MATDFQVIAEIERQLDIIVPLRKGNLHSHIIGYRSLDDRTIIELSLPNSEIDDISSLQSLRSIKRLYLSNNNIVDLHPLRELSNLTALWLNGNSISNVEPLISLENLTELWLNENKIENIDALSSNLRLESLWLSNNKINDISALKSLDRLHTLDLRNNPIEKLPSWVVTKKYMDVTWKNENFYPEGITFFSNPLTDPPPEIVQLGKEAIKTWFRSGDALLINELKILMVGHGGVGKTTILKCLTGKTPNPDEKATHQINISNDTFLINAQEVAINFWDFGGQEIMHTTHQFFLSRRSLYLLVLDGRRDEDPEYWLKIIESFGGNSPVIIILNKTDTNRRYDVDRIFLQKKYPFIFDFCKTSCKSDDIIGISKLHNTISLALEKIPLLKSRWPKSWNDVKKEIINISENYITQIGYIKICNDNKISDPNIQEILADYLHDIGVSVHFKGLNLSNMFILQPKWVSQAAYKIINSSKVANNHGVFTKDDLTSILRKEEETDFHFPFHTFSYIITLMEKFELCFPLDNEKYLIPDLINIQQPKLPEQKGDILKFYFEYESLLPSSIITRFIVRMNRDIKDNLCWRTGIVLAVDIFESLAIIIADLKERKIHISVSGSGRREHFAIIRKTFKDLHSSFEKLNVLEKICLPGQDNIYVSYKELAGYSKAGKEEYFSGEVEKTYIVKDVLANIESESVLSSRYEWDAFIVHSSKDLNLINKIKEDFKERRITYWLDEERIMPGDNIIKEITRGLTNSAVIIPCLSNNQATSGWTQKEYEMVLYRVISGMSSQKVAPLILDDMKDNEIPLFLSPVRCERYLEKDQYKNFLIFWKGNF